MIGTPPPHALARPSFRFPGLAAHAGRAPLGGNREGAIACLMAARVCAAMLPPHALSQDVARQRAEQARLWLGALAAPVAARAPFLTAIESASRSDRTGASAAIDSLTAAVAELLDEASAREMSALARELASA